MAVGRMIRVSLSLSESFAGMSEFARLFLVMIILHLDDFGRIDGSPVRLRAQVIPLFCNRSVDDVVRAVAETIASGTLKAYDAEGRVYICAPKFDTFQSGLHKRTKSRFPDPEAGRVISAAEYIARFSGESMSDSGKFREVPSQQNRTEGKGTEEKGTGREQEQEEEPPFSDQRSEAIPLFAVDSESDALSKRLLDRIVTNKPDFRTPTPRAMQSWSKSIDLMIRKDHRKPDQIARVIDWATNDNFWKSNILSADSLREKFDKLELQMNGTNTGGRAGKKEKANGHDGRINPANREQFDAEQFRSA